MNTLLFIVLALIALSSYASGYFFSFKERYKEWYEKLFKENEKPSQWRFSRQTNHDRYILSQKAQLYLVIAFVVISLLCLEYITISFGTYFITFAVAVVVPEILGAYFGKHICNRMVYKECERYKIDIPAL